MTMATALVVIGLSTIVSMASPGTDDGLVGHWDFNEGKGEVLTDRAGGRDGRVQGASWQTSSGGGGLRFAAKNSLVAVPCKLDMAGDLTFVAWAKPLASPFRNPRTNYIILASGDYAQNGFAIRVEGDSGHLRYVGFRDGGVGSFTSQTAIAAGTFHHIVFVKKGQQCVWYINGRADGAGPMPRTGTPAKTLWIGDPSQSFDGLIDDVKVFSRALSHEEVLQDYRDCAETYGRDTSRFGKIRLTPFLYPRQSRAMAEVDFLGVLPLKPGERLLMELGIEGGAAVQSRDVSLSAAAPLEMFTFDLNEAAGGRYELRARLLDGDKEKTRAAVSFGYPPGPIRLPSPTEKLVRKLSAPAPPIPFTVRLSKGGGFVLRVGDAEYPVESRFSFPHGGENVLSPSHRIEGGPHWKIDCPEDGKSPRVVGECSHYRIERRLSIEPHRVVVRDTICNRTAEALGIILHNQVVTKGRQMAALLGGEPAGGMRQIKLNPTVFLSQENLGLGLVALDDVFIVQSRGFHQNGRGGIMTREFALDGGAKYTLEWALYPNGTGDYYDFINLVRRDEKRGGVTVEGGFAFQPVGTVPSRDHLEIRGLKYFSAGGLARVIDDPAISLEGIEFVEYPKVCEQLRRQFRAVNEMDPTICCMFHIAHALYATNKPEEKFPDSRLVDATGRQYTYGNSDAYYYGGSYFSKERLDDGWRWWIFYPTRENSFGKAMLKSVDVMVDQLGCRGAFMDGFMWTYGDAYTYDRWDGHSADIDPETKTIVRRKASVLLLSQGLLAEYVRKFNSRGGTVIANTPVFTRTIAKEKMVCDQECRVGPDMHLTHTPITLGRSSMLSSERHVYRDVREALASGNLYFYYGEGELTARSVPAYMYPITIEDIRAGCVTGRERIVTMNEGVYGWRGNADLHQVWLFDARGAAADHAFLTSVDGDGVRTELPLAAEQTAVLRHVPVELRSAKPVTAHCVRYDADEIRFILHGHGPVDLVVRHGEFAIEPGTEYSINGKVSGDYLVDKAGVLNVPLVLDGQSEIVITDGCIANDQAMPAESFPKGPESLGSVTGSPSAASALPFVRSWRYQNWDAPEH
jgi:concanavalin A-like lectin/glucanase superfamily protein